VADPSAPCRILTSAAQKALKSTTEPVASADAREMAKAAARLSHFYTLEQAMPHIRLLHDFARWGPQLYACNHPPRVRAQFTAAALDAALAESGLPQLPIVLLHLIGEYQPAELPYIPDSAYCDPAEQARRRAAHTAYLHPPHEPSLPNVIQYE